METLIYRGYAGRRKHGKRSIPVEITFNRDSQEFSIVVLPTAPKQPFNIGGVRVTMDTDKTSLDVPADVKRLIGCGTGVGLMDGRETRCGRCGHDWDGEDNWNAIMRQGRIVGFLCSDCQTPGENSEAVINEATTDYITDPFGLVRRRPKTGESE